MSSARHGVKPHDFTKDLPDPTDALGPINVYATRDAGVTAAAGTSLTHHLFAKVFTLGKSLHKV